MESDFGNTDSQCPSIPLIKQEARDRNSTPHAQSGRSRASFRERCSPLLVSFLSIALCSALAVLLWTHSTFDGHSLLYSTATHHRATVQVVVNILASILGFIQTFAVFKAFNMRMRSMLAGRKLTLDVLRLQVSISKNTFDQNLPFGLLLVSAFVCAFALLPTSFWTGALTPQITTILQQGFHICRENRPGLIPLSPTARHRHY